MKRKSFIILATLSLLLFSCNDNPVEPTPVNPTPVDPTPVEPTPVVDENVDGCTGLIVEKEKTTYSSGETISFDDLKVFATNIEGTKKVQIKDFNLEYYQDNHKIDKAEDMKGGRFQYWVSTTLNNLEVSTFDFIYVNAHIKSLALNAENTQALYSQKAGSDIISSTWTFKLTYTNGYQREINMFNAGISYDKDNFSTMTQGEYSLLVTYTEENNETRSTLVNYSIL